MFAGNHFPGGKIPASERIMTAAFVGDVSENPLKSSGRFRDVPTGSRKALKASHGNNRPVPVAALIRRRICRQPTLAVGMTRGFALVNRRRMADVETMLV
jgi:hypothetical protein